MSLLTARPDDVPEHGGNVWDPTYADTPAPLDVNGDRPVSGVNLSASLALKIGKAADDMSAAAARVGQMARALERNTPVDSARTASGVFVTGTPLVLDFGTPDYGTFWEVGSWAVGGTEVNVTVNASHVGLYTSGVASLAAAGLANCVGFAQNPTASLTLPLVDYVSPGQITVNDGEHLFAIVFGGSNGLTYVANAQVRVFSVVASQGQTAFTA